MISVKICGVTNLQDALFCVKCGVSALGFIFAPSKRQVTVETVYEISRQIPPFVMKVGVFVDEDPLTVQAILKDCQLDLAQIHGVISAKMVEILPGRVIKVFKAGFEQPDSSWKELPLRAILVDSYSPTMAGGTGQTFDWSLFTVYRSLNFPMILAGGLHPGNIQRAIRITRPDAVDLSSGVEVRPGVKDRQKILDLVEQLKNLEE